MQDADTLEHAALVGCKHPTNGAGSTGRSAADRALALMHKRKPYKWPVCGAEVPDEPMRVPKHQMLHVRRRQSRVSG